MTLKATDRNMTPGNWQIGGSTGPLLKPASTTVIEARDAADSIYAILRSNVTPAGNNDVLVFQNATTAGSTGASKLARMDASTGRLVLGQLPQFSATDLIWGRSTAGAGTAEEIACTSTGRSILAAASMAAIVSLLSLVIGTNTQAFSQKLTDIAALAVTIGNIQVATGSTWASRSRAGSYGSGTGGAHTVSGTETETTSRAWSNFTCGNGNTYITAGFPQSVNGTLTVASGGIISDDGTAAATSTGGAALTAQGARAAVGGGGNGRNTSGVGSNGTGATANTGFLVEWGTVPVAGAGGTATSAGGTGANGNAGSLGQFCTPALIFSGGAIANASPTLRRVGSAGGGGGGGCNVGTGTAVSGGGGGGAGVVWISCYILTGGGLIRAKGGAAAAASGVTGNGAAGGGGGGTGGIVLVACWDSSGWSGSVASAGGAKGTGLGGGADGADGGNGQATLFTEAA